MPSAATFQTDACFMFLIHFSNIKGLQRMVQKFLNKQSIMGKKIFVFKKQMANTIIYMKKEKMFPKHTSGSKGNGNIYVKTLDIDSCISCSVFKVTHHTTS